MSEVTETPEEVVERVLDAIAEMAEKEGMTIAVSASIPVGAANYTRVMAKSAYPGERGARLVIAAMEQMVGFMNHVKAGRRPRGVN